MKQFIGERGIEALGRKRDHRILQGTQISFGVAPAGDLGRLEGSPQSSGARLSGQSEQIHSYRILAAIRARHEPARIPVGVAQASRAGQLLSEQPQERSKVPLNNRRLLDASYALVVSSVMTKPSDSTSAQRSDTGVCEPRCAF